MEVVAQILGILGMICFISSFQFKNGLTIILAQLIGATFYCIQYGLFSIIDGTLYMGLLMNLLSIFRGLVYYKRSTFRADSNFWIYGFFTGYFACYVLLFTVFNVEASAKNIIIEFMPVLGMILTHISFRLKSAKTIRAYGLTTSLPWGVYHGFHSSIGGLIGEIINFISALIGIIRYDVKRKKEEL